MINLSKLVVMFSLVSIVAILSCLQDQSQTRSVQLHKLFDDYWEFVLKSSPSFATYIGDHRYDDKQCGTSAHYRIIHEALWITNFVTRMGTSLLRYFYLADFEKHVRGGQWFLVHG